MSTAVAEAPTSEPQTADVAEQQETHGAQPAFDVPAEVSEVVEQSTTPDAAEAAQAPAAPPVEEETAPGPEAAVGAVDAGVTPAPEPEKIGSRTISYEEQEQHLREIEEAERVVAAREEEWEELKAETKTAKDAFDAAVERLRKVIRTHKPGHDPLFEQGKTPATDGQPARNVPEEVSAAVAPALNWSIDNDCDFWEARTATGLSYPDVDETPIAAAYFVKPFDDGKAGFDADEELLAALGIEKLPDDFDSVDAAKAFAQMQENKIWAAGLAPPDATPAAADDDAWRSVPLESLTPAIPPKKLTLLAENTPPITTMGDWQAWCEKKGDPWFWKDVKGFGEGGRDAMEAALMPFWAARQKQAHADAADKAIIEQAAKLPGADELHALNDPALPANDFTEDAIDNATRETVAKIEKHLVIEVARRTSGPWQCGWWLNIGRLERMQHLGTAPATFPTRAEAIEDALAAVSGQIERANGQITAKKDQAAAREVRTALEAAKPTA